MRVFRFIMAFRTLIASISDTFSGRWLETCDELYDWDWFAMISQDLYMYILGPSNWCVDDMWFCPILLMTGWGGVGWGRVGWGGARCYRSYVVGPRCVDGRVFFLPNMGFGWVLGVGGWDNNKRVSFSATCSSLATWCYVTCSSLADCNLMLRYLFFACNLMLRYATCSSLATWCYATCSSLATWCYATLLVLHLQLDATLRYLFFTCNLMLRYATCSSLAIWCYPTSVTLLTYPPYGQLISGLSWSDFWWFISST